MKCTDIFQRRVQLDWIFFFWESTQVLLQLWREGQAQDHLRKSYSSHTWNCQEYQEVGWTSFGPRVTELPTWPVLLLFEAALWVWANGCNQSWCQNLCVKARSLDFTLPYFGRSKPTCLQTSPRATLHPSGKSDYPQELQLNHRTGNKTRSLSPKLKLWWIHRLNQGSFCHVNLSTNRFIKINFRFFKLNFCFLSKVFKNI